jgi:hypothetical protein
VRAFFGSFFDRGSELIIFTDRELQRAWRTNQKAATVEQLTNAHRLLLFYAVECGLKAVLLKRQRVDRTDLCLDLADVQHNVNRLLDRLRAGKELQLPDQLWMKPLKNDEERKFSCGEINQMWRYGGDCTAISDRELEKKLQDILTWIKQELNQ